MLPASNRGAGQNMCFPDVCNTPVGPATVPIPYPNIAMNAQAVGFSMTTKWSGVNALNMGSQIPMTMGDEAGVAHPTIKGAARYTMGSPVVMVDKMPAIHLTCLTNGNNMNAPVGSVLVPSVTNVMICQRGAADLQAAAITTSRTLPGNVVYATIACLSPGVASEMFVAVKHASAVVLDLRDCPGGALDAAVDLARFFLPANVPLAELTEGDGERSTIMSTKPACDLPLVVMIDERTASAAELFAAAVQANRRATLVGRRSYGKTHGMRACGARVTTIRWEHKRIKPDVPSHETGDALLRLAWGLALRGHEGADLLR